MIRCKQNSFIFWQKWLFYSSLLIGVGVIPVFVIKHNPVFEIYERSLSKALNNHAGMSEDLNRVIQFLRGPFGATISCCYLLLAYIAAVPFRRKESWSRNAIVVSFGTWIIIDTAFCLYNGVYFQIYIINLLSLMQKALPLFFTWNCFSDHPAGVGGPRRGV